MEFPEQYKNTVVSKRDYWRAVAKSEGFAFLESIPMPSPEALSALQESHVLRLRCIPFKITDENLDVAVDDPLDYDLRDQLKVYAPKPVTYYVALPEKIDEILDKHYRKKS